MDNKMKAAVYYAARDIRLEEVAVPEPSEGEVLVKVLKSGMCGTDASEWVAGPKVFPVDNQHPVTGHIGPFIPGHEFVGEIIEANGSANFNEGDLVATGAGIWCGTCTRCIEGRTNMCLSYSTLGLNRNGGLAEFATVPEHTLLHLPDSLSVEDAALAQPLAVGIHAARRAGVKEGQSVVIIGGGAIGSFVLAGLKHIQNADVTVIDFPGPKLERALRFGADRVIEAGETAKDEILGVLGSNPDVVIEASGAPGQLNFAIHLVARGGRVLAVGVPKGMPETDIHTLVFSEITLETTLAHICGEDLEVALEILNMGLLGRELIEKVVPLADVGASLEDLASGRVEGKILVDPTMA